MNKPFQFQVSFLCLVISAVSHGELVGLDDELMEYKNTEDPNYAAEPVSNPINKQEPDRYEETEWEEDRDNEFSDSPEQVPVEAAESSEYDELDDEAKVKFFNYVDKNWSGENESD